MTSIIAPYTMRTSLADPLLYITWGKSARLVARCAQCSLRVCELQSSITQTLDDVMELAKIVPISWSTWGENYQSILSV